MVTWLVTAMIALAILLLVACKMPTADADVAGVAVSRLASMRHGETVAGPRFWRSTF